MSCPELVLQLSLEKKGLNAVAGREAEKSPILPHFFSTYWGGLGAFQRHLGGGAIAGDQKRPGKEGPLGPGKNSGLCRWAGLHWEAGVVSRTREDDGHVKMMATLCGVPPPTLHLYHLL